MRWSNTDIGNMISSQREKEKIIAKIGWQWCTTLLQPSALAHPAFWLNLMSMFLQFNFSFDNESSLHAHYVESHPDLVGNLGSAFATASGETSAAGLITNATTFFFVKNHLLTNQ